MPAKFVIFTNASTKEPVLINANQVRLAHKVPGHSRVKLVMDSEHAVDVEGDLKSVWEALMGETGEKATFVFG
jgi:hypothetical protein